MNGIVYLNEDDQNDTHSRDVILVVITHAPTTMYNVEPSKDQDKQKLQPKNRSHAS